MSTPATEETRTCGACRQTIALSRFSDNRKTCNTCRNARAKERAMAKQSQSVVASDGDGAANAVGPTKTCVVCREVKPMCGFEAGRATCRECRIAQRAQCLEQKECIEVDGKQHTGPLPVQCRTCTKPFVLERAREFQYKTDQRRYTDLCRACINQRGYTQAYRERRRTEDEEQYLRNAALVAKHYRDVHPEMADARTARRHASADAKISQVKKSAKRRGIDWQDTDAQVLAERIASDPCMYCGCSIEETGQMHGLDRVDNSEGYSLGNAVACCYVCNMMKRTFSIETFVNKARLIAERWKDAYPAPPPAQDNTAPSSPAVDSTAGAREPSSRASIMGRPKRPRIIHHPELQGRRVAIVHRETGAVGHLCNTLADAARLFRITAESASMKIRDKDAIWLAPHWVARDATPEDVVCAEEHARVQRHLRLKGPYYVSYASEPGTKIRVDAMHTLATMLKLSAREIKDQLMQSPTHEMERFGIRVYLD